MISEVSRSSGISGLTIGDTVTRPTDAMFEVMKSASRGDDVFAEDETTNAFQDYIAKITGKEAALFVSSGTQGNQLALRTHLQQPPHSVLCDWRAHVYVHEAGGIAYHSQASITPVKATNGHHLTLEDVQANIVDEDIHHAPTKVVSLENSCDGTLFPLAEMERISKWVKSQGLIMHLDGARLFNVVAANDGPAITAAYIADPDSTPPAQGLDKHLKKYCDPFDSVSLCLSKGIGAPIGSVLVGSKPFIAKARWFRKVFGGGTRQCGFIVAAAKYSLDNHWPLLPRTHALAAYLTSKITAPPLSLKLSTPTESNMVWIDMPSIECEPSHIVKAAADAGLSIFASGRVVIHHQITKYSIDKLIDVLKDIQSQVKDGKIPRITAPAKKVNTYATTKDAVNGVKADLHEATYDTHKP